MRSLVFDTNVIVAAHLSPYGPPGQLLNEVYARRLRLSYDVRLAAEYREVLLRKKFGLPRESVSHFMRILEDQDLVSGLPLRVSVPDKDDTMFLEVAAATENKVLVTGNLRHYPSHACGLVRLLTPSEAWKLHCQ